jgi:hypothetical protein
MHSVVAPIRSKIEYLPLRCDRAVSERAPSSLGIEVVLRQFALGLLAGGPLHGSATLVIRGEYSGMAGALIAATLFYLAHPMAASAR